VLIHELTHVWQYEREGIDYTINSIVEQNLGDAYNYGYNDDYNGSGGEDDLIAANGDFSVFNVEQQATIIEHYYVRRYVEKLDASLYEAWQPYADIVYE
jgi:hypothetical protein